MTDIRKAADPLTYLDEVDARAEAATEGEWVARTSEATMNDRSEWRIGHPSRPKVFSAVTAAADAEFIAHARQDLPALSKALRAVLAIHAREVIAVHEGYGEEAWCSWCQEHYPCSTARAIQAALAVNDEGGK